MEINQNPLGRIENIVIRDPQHLTIKYIPVLNGNNEMAIEAKLIGTATRTEQIEREIVFNAPNNDVVLKVINVLDEIEVKDAKVVNGNILVTGYLNSCIMYTTTKRPDDSNNSKEKNNQSANGYVNMNNNKSNEKNKNKEKERPKPSCDLVDYSVAMDGVLRHTTVRIPFTAFLPAVGYLEDDICIVSSTNVLKSLGSKAITPIYEEVYEEDQANANANTPVVPEQKFIKGIINKTLIELTVDIKRYPKE
jgi:hypothetical protein